MKFHYQNNCSGEFKLVEENGEKVLKCDRCGNYASARRKKREVA